MSGIDWMAEGPGPVTATRRPGEATPPGGREARGAGADGGAPPAGEVHALVRPAAGVVPRAFEALESLEVGDLRVGETAGGHDAEPRGDAVAAVGLDGPARGRPVEHRGGAAGAAL